MAHNHVLVCSSSHSKLQASQLIQELLRWTSFVDAELPSFPPLPITTKYFSASVAFQMCSFSDVLNARAPPGCDGLIAVCDVQTDRASSFPWGLFDAPYMFRVLVLFTADEASGGDSQVDQWHTQAVASGFELVVRSRNYAVPAVNAERQGLLRADAGSDLCGSSRVLQLLHNVMWPKNSRSAVKDLRGSLGRRNRLLVVGNSYTDAQQILLQSGLVRQSSHRAAAFPRDSFDASQEPGICASSEWRLSTRYFHTDILVSFVHKALFASQMQDVVRVALQEETTRHGPVGALLVFSTTIDGKVASHCADALTLIAVVSDVALQLVEEKDIQSKFFCHRSTSSFWKLSAFEEAWFRGKDFEVIALHEPGEEVLDDNEDDSSSSGTVGFSRLREVIACAQFPHRQEPAAVRTQLAQPNRVFVIFLCGGPDRMILERSCSSLKPLLRCNSNDDRWQLDLLTKYYACSVELICIDGFESLRSIEAKVLGQRSSSSQLDSDGFLFILPPWANTAPLVSSAMHRFASVASILLSHRDDHTETNDDHSSDIDESSSTLREASGLRLLFCPGLTEEDDSGSNSETPSMSGLVCRFLEERPRLSLEVLFAEESPAACEQMVPSRLVEALECIEWAHYTARMPSAAPNNSSSATLHSSASLPSKDSEAAAAPESSQETSTNSQQGAACGLATTCKAPNTAPEADEESVEYGCELPPHMLMDPFTLTSYVCDVLVPRNSSSSQVDADDAAVTEKLMHLMNVVKKEGHRLRRAERQRQAKILAERLSLLMGE